MKSTYSWRWPPRRSTDSFLSVRAVNVIPTSRFLGRTALLALASVTLPFASGQDHKKWSDYGGGSDSSHYVALSQITRENVKQLQVAWTYSTRDSIGYQFNPIIVDNVMYVLARNYSLVALDADTGKEIWIHGNLSGITTR